MNARRRRVTPTGQLPLSRAHTFVESSSIESVPITAIIVDPTTNPRRRLWNIEELAASIRSHGLLQPVIVRRLAREDERYQLVAGYRRMAAIKLLAERYPKAGWTSVQVVIRGEDADEAYVLTLVENLQREDLSPREESEALGRLVRERRWTTRQVASAIGRSQPYVSRRLRVYEDKVLRAFVLNKQLPVSVAEELLAAEPDTRAGLAKRAAGEQWDQKRARSEARGHSAAFHPQLREQLRAIRDLVSNATLSVGEKELLRHFAEYLLNEVQAEDPLAH